MMLRCDRAALDTDQGILFCDDGGPCGKRLHCGDCPLVTQKEEKSFEIGQRVRIVGPTADERATYVGLQWGHDFSAVEIAAVFRPQQMPKN